MKTVKNFIKAIREEKEGFSFGEPWRFSKKSLTAVMPILRESTEKRDYLVLAEAKKVKIEDTGNIDSLLITNNEDKPVFVRAGEIFKGKTQERAATMSRVVMPGATEKINVVCVHQSKPIMGGGNVGIGGFAPSSVIISAGTGDPMSQSHVWAKTVAYCASAKSVVGNLNVAGVTTERTEIPRWEKMDDLASNIKKFSKAINEVLKGVPFTENQVGIVLLDTNGCAGLEAFNLSVSWKAIRENLIRREGEKIADVDKEGVFKYKPEKAKGTVKKLLKEKFEEKSLFKDKDTETIGISHGDFVGEATILNDKVIHLNLTRG